MLYAAIIASGASAQLAPCQDHMPVLPRRTSLRGSTLEPKALQWPTKVRCGNGGVASTRGSGRGVCARYFLFLPLAAFLSGAASFLTFDGSAVLAGIWLTAPFAVLLLLPTAAALLFEPRSQRCERRSTIITSNLPFEDWTSVLGSERLTGALLDRLTHHVSILTMNGDSYRLKQSV